MEWSYAFADGLAVQFIVAGGYAVMIFALQAFMKNRTLQESTRSKVNWAMYVHNLALSFASTVMGVIMVYESYMDGRYASWNDVACRVTPNVGLYGLINFCYFMSKIWEYLDTVFLCINKKRVIFLHFWHHMTTFAVGTIIFNFPSGIFAYINCFIHTLMYLHYAHPSKFVRPIMTSLQIIQFLIMIGTHTYTWWTACHPAPQLYFYEFLFALFVCTSYLVLFLNFYVQQYVKPPRTTSAPKKHE